MLSVILVPGLFAKDAAKPVFVRVAVVKDAACANILIAGNYKIINAITKEVLSEGRYLHSSTLTSSAAGFTLNNTALNTSAIEIDSMGGAKVYINDRVFRGRISVFKSEKGLVVVNTVELEEYLYGVIRNEVSTWWPMEALKAQAIASRTYALYQIKEFRGRDYDVTASVSSQVYGGIFSEKWRTNRAVDSTRGKVLVYNGAIFPAYFHAACGGATYDAANLWKMDLLPLKGVKCDWCKKSPHYSWERWITLEEAGKRLESAGYSTGRIQAIETVKKDPSGRVLEVQVKGTQGAVNIAGKNLRLILGADMLRSTNFKATVIGDYIAFEGLGWGHGVGMCQWGAYYLSRAGKKADEILQFYYPGAKVAEYNTLTSLRGAQATKQSKDEIASPLRGSQ